MKALVTGSSGFVGKHLCKRLVADGYQVIGVSRNNFDKSTNNLVNLCCDITNKNKLKEILSAYIPDQIFHLAGPAFIPNSYQQPLLAYDTVVNGTLSLYESVRELNRFNPLILYVGSADIYGSGHNLPIDELAPFIPTNPYSASKACADLISEQYFRTYGMRILRARPFNHTGPGQSEDFVCSSFAKQIAEMEISDGRIINVGNIKVERDFLDVRDVVEAYLSLMKKGIIGQAYNVCSGRTYSIEEILLQLLNISKIESYSIVTSVQKLRKDDPPIRVGNNEKINHDTGWVPTYELKNTVKDLLYYWRGIIDGLS